MNWVLLLQQRALIIGNLPIAILFFQMETPLLHSPVQLFFSIFGQLLFILYSECIAVTCRRVTWSPFHFLFEFVGTSFFFLLYYASLFSSQAPGQLFWCPESPWNSSKRPRLSNHKGPNKVQGARWDEDVNDLVLDHTSACSSKQHKSYRPEGVYSSWQIFTECLQGTRLCFRPFGYIDKQRSQISLPLGK